MNKQTFDRFRARARAVRLPDDVSDRVLLAPQAEKDLPRRRSLTRRAAVGAGLGVLGAAAALLAASVVLRPDERDPAAPAGNWFALRAYAEGLEQGEGVVLAQRSISLAGSISGTEDDWLYTAHSIDLSCEGSGIDQITYAIEGDYVREEGQPPMDRSEKAVWLGALYSHPDQVSEGEAYPSDNGTPTSFTVSYDGQAAEADSFNRQVWTCFPSDDEIVACSPWVMREQGDSFDDELASMRLMAHWRLLLERRSAELLAQTTLVMTVTFTDGSEQTKRYAIAPREDFDEVYQAYLDEESRYSALRSYYADAAEKPDEYYEAERFFDGADSKWPDLYTITELDG